MSSTQIVCQLRPIEDIVQLADSWQRLENDTDCSYFLSWGWIGTWLAQLPDTVKPLVFTALESAKVVGLAIVVSRPSRRHGILHSRSLYLNKTGDAFLDEITIEYNGILVDASRRAMVMTAALDFFLVCDWDEVFIDAAVSHIIDGIHPSNFWTIRRQMAWSAYGVDLQRLREPGNSHIDMVGANTRHKIRHALRAYQQLGPTRIEVARDRQEARFWLEELRHLHQASWMAKGFSGAFDNAFFEQFHRALVFERFGHGEIQLLRIGFGDRTIGYLYNFVWNGVVFSYQSGFDYNALPGEKNWPGAIAHCLAIEFNQQQGALYYDFLGGDSQLKRTLSTVTTSLDWIVAQRNCLKFKLEHCARTVRNILLRTESMSALKKTAGNQ